MKVVSIDPAPRKGLTVFDGSDFHVPVSEASSFLEGLIQESDVLLCWDAPLTGPSSKAVHGRGSARVSDFTQRPIESFFSRKKTGFRTPKGISVRGYAGCPHWAMSRSLLGLPRVGPFDAPESSLPFSPVYSDEPRPTSGAWIVEIHPAVAAWLWCRDSWIHDTWDYKKDLLARETIWNRLSSWMEDPLDVPDNDDQLDARIGFVLGSLWASGSDKVRVLGSLEFGTFLLPSTSRLEQAFEDFADDFGAGYDS